MGNSQTSVANGGDQTIYVTVGAEQQHVEMISRAFRQAVIDANFKVGHVVDTRGFTKILPGYSLEFQSPCSGGRVYISIFSQKNSEAVNPGPFELICCAHPWKEDQGIVINRDNQMQPAQEGKIWIDTNWRDHSRPTGDSQKQKNIHDSVNNADY